MICSKILLVKGIFSIYLSICIMMDMPISVLFCLKSRRKVIYAYQGLDGVGATLQTMLPSTFTFIQK